MSFAGTDAANTVLIDSNGFSCEDADVRRDGYLDVLSTNRNINVINATNDIFRRDIKADNFSISIITAATAARRPDVCATFLYLLSLSLTRLFTLLATRRFFACADKEKEELSRGSSVPLCLARCTHA